MTTKTLTLDEINVLRDFSYALQGWQADGAGDVTIEYDHEYKDFVVTTGETNVRKGRISKLQATMTAWAESQISNFGYQNKTVNVFALGYTAGNVSINLGFEQAASEQSA